MDVGLDGDVGFDGLGGELARVDVDDHAARFGGEAGEIEAAFLDIEPGGERDQAIGILHREVRAARPGAAEHAHVERVRLMHDVLGGKRQDDGDSGLFEQCVEEGTGPGGVDAVAGDEERAARGTDGLDHARHAGGHGGLLVFGGRFVSFQLGFVDHGALDVQGKLEDDGARATGGRLMPGIFQFVADAARVFDGDGVLGDGLGHGDGVAFLGAHQAEFRIVGDDIGADLAGEEDDGDGIDPAAHHAGEGVDGAGAGGADAESGASGVARVALGGDPAGLFVVVAVVAHAGIAAHGIDQVHDAATGDHECIAYTAIDKELDDVIRQFDHDSL